MVDLLIADISTKKVLMYKLRTNRRAKMLQVLGQGGIRTTQVILVGH